MPGQRRDAGCAGVFCQDAVCDGRHESELRYVQQVGTITTAVVMVVMTMPFTTCLRQLCRQ